MTIHRDRRAWLQGDGAQCEPPRFATVSPRRVVLLGAPGVGKGTQAELLSERLGACQLSTGDVFRAAGTLKPCELSPALSEAVEFMRAGALVPDATVLDVVRERSRCFHCGGGFLLDGFPRTLPQAEALDELFDAEGVRLDAVLSYELPIEKIVSRISGRRSCDQCKSVYHVEARPPRTENVCDHCGNRLTQREDDRPEAVRVRMQAYETSTAPLAEFYRRRGLLISIEAEGTPEEIFDRTIKALDGR